MKHLLNFAFKSIMPTLLCVLFILGALIGCASKTVLVSSTPISNDQCSVKVHSSREAAASNGKIEELCIISGTSSGSFSHTVATAINKHKNDACECGANDVYIQAQDAGTFGTASVTMVAFRYMEEPVVTSISENQTSIQEEYRKSKLCSKKGGVWVQGKCEIELK